MALVLNLAGGIQEIKIASTNKEIIEAVNRTSEEFFRTIGILFYIRYLKYQRADNKKFNEDIAQLVQNHFGSPTFAKWIKLQELCRGELSELGDQYTLNFNKKINEHFDARSATLARKILVEIHNLKNNHNFSPPRHIEKIKFLEQIRLDRNRRSHHWDDNKKLLPLVKSGIKEFIVEVIEDIFKDITIEILKIDAIKLDCIEVISNINHNAERKSLQKSDLSPDLGKIYVIYDPQENLFSYGTNLIHFDNESNRIFVYSECDKNKTTYENVPSIGAYENISLQTKGLLSIFGLSKDDVEINSNLITLSQKFGEIKIYNSAIHNLPKPSPYYVKREKLEAKLIQKLLHRRHETTMLNGGGGYGKTELAKKVIWNILNGEFQNEILEKLKFKYIIWISGKITYFEYGQISETEQSFNTLEDLLDCALYVTDHTDLIKNSLDYKKKAVISILSGIESSLLILDNLETVSEKKEIWDYFDELSHEVPTEIKIIVTTRVSGNYPYQTLNVEPMSEDESRRLIMEQLDRYDIMDKYGNEDSIKEIIQLSAGAPLLILYIVQLLSSGYNIAELKGNMSAGYDKALNFICKYQWDDLTKDAQKLLIAISIAGGKISFAQAKTLCSFNDGIFQDSKEKLKKWSFVIDDELVNSILAILPPINRFVSNESYSHHPDVENELKKRWQWISKGERSDPNNPSSSVLDSEDIAIRNLFQNADRLIRLGAIPEAYNWYQQAISQFPESHLAWRTIGDFEFKYIDEEKGRLSFKKSIELNPNDYVTFTNLAFWEGEIGRNKNEIAYIRRSIELNEKVNDLTNDDATRKITTDHIAQSLLTMATMEIKRTYNTWGIERKPAYAIAESYIDKAIALIQNNFYSDPRTKDEITHNVIDYSTLAKAYLEKAKRYQENKKAKLYYHNLALINVFYGLQLRPDNYKLTFLLGDHNIKRLLREDYLINYEDADEKIVGKILKIEEKIDDSIRKLKGQAFPTQ